MDEPVNDLTNLPLFGKCPEKNIDALLYKIIDAVANSSTPDYTRFSEIWTLEEWFNVISVLKQAIISLSKGNFDKGLADGVLQPLPELHRERLVHCCTIRKNDIHLGLVRQASAISECYLKDFNFRAKYALASDKISSVEEPLIQLSLTVSEDGIQRTVPLEMNVTELKSFITSLEAANKAVLQLTV